jgi:hypothetical protein
MRRTRAYVLAITTDEQLVPAFASPIPRDVKQYKSSRTVNNAV